MLIKNLDKETKLINKIITTTKSEIIMMMLLGAFLKCRNPLP